MGRVHVKHQRPRCHDRGSTHSWGLGALLWGARGELDGDPGRPCIQPTPSGLGSPAPLPRRVQSQARPVRVWGPGSRSASWVPGDLVHQEGHHQGELGPQAGPPGAGTAFGPAADKSRLRWVTAGSHHAGRPRGPPPPQLLKDPTGPTGSRIMFISPSPSSGASSEVLVLLQIRSELIPFLQRTPVAKWKQTRQTMAFESPSRAGW